MPVCASFFAAASDDVAFTKVKLPGGWLGNMSPHPIMHEGLRCLRQVNRRQFAVLEVREG